MHTRAKPSPWLLPAVLSCAAAFVLAPAPAHAQLRHYRLDPVHTRIAFQVSHAGFSNPIGTFSRASGSLDFDPDDWSSARVEVTVPLATLNLGDADWQGKILDRTFFDASKFPSAHFVSTKVEHGEGNHARVTGELTLHGRSAPLVLEVDLNALKRHPLTFHRTAGFSARGTLSRKAFGMDAWQRVVGDAVTLTIEAEALLEGPAHDKAGDTGDDQDSDKSSDKPADKEADDAAGQ